MKKFLLTLSLAAGALGAALIPAKADVGDDAYGRYEPRYYPRTEEHYYEYRVYRVCPPPRVYEERVILAPPVRYYRGDYCPERSVRFFPPHHGVRFFFGF